ncbi:MAG: formate dehydrogenase accessory protein FdhE [Betaproteobacteria bacterium HGW-Betaproteobacteria-6]|jgi:FdhE protein|nr:MAG: formate dehydrogenase accessory protein FdhE [Betaproteobacteria bacterium HGW-Betaproteobacteria-6]
MQTQPIDFHPPTEEAASYLLPKPASIFAERAKRFAGLSTDHTLGEWLTFLGLLSQAQHDVAQGLPVLPLPDAAILDQAHTHGMPPLNAASLPLPAVWHQVLRELAERLLSQAPEAGQASLSQLLAASDAQRDELARVLLNGEPDAEQAALLPFVAAALQVVFTVLASQLDVSQLQPLDVHGVCPCCGSLPVASVVRQADGISNLRYLHCALCNTEWNLARATCAACGDDEKLAQHHIEGSNGAARTETCDNCQSYLKIFYQEKDMQLDPVADDLATLALDMLVDEAGYERAGPNLLLIGANA